MAELELYPEKQNWTHRDGLTGRWGTKWEDRPLKAVLVGGRPEYGNVRKLPDELWKHFGIVVVTHLGPEYTPSSAATQTSANEYDVAIVLSDMISHVLMEWAKTIAEQAVYTPSTWSKLYKALESVGIKPYAGSNFEPPAGQRKRQPAPPKVQPDPNYTIPTVTLEAPVALIEKKPEKKNGLPDDIRSALQLLKEAMLTHNFDHVEVTVRPDRTLAIEYRRMVMVSQEGEDSV